MCKRLSVLLISAALVVCAAAVAHQKISTETSNTGFVSIQKTARGASTTGILVIPWRVNYQGYLTDDSGSPVSDTLDMNFSIWDASVSGTQLWNEDQTVAVENGLFNVILGSIAPIPQSIFQSGQTRWMEMTVAAQILSPRTELTSVSYAYRAVSSDSADQAHESDMVDGFHASATPGTDDLFTLSFGDARFVNENQVDAITSPMILDGEIATADIADGAVNSLKILDSTLVRTDVHRAFKAPYSDTADYALAAPAFPDNDWTITGSVIHPSGSYAISMRASNVLYGTMDSTHVNLGVACTTGASGFDWDYCSVGGGLGNRAGGASSTVAGGWDNRATDDGATVAGGMNNRATYLLATVGGGQNNVASNSRSTVCGGSENLSDGLYSVVAGGGQNSATGDASTVSGGWMNSASGDYSAVPGGGFADTAAASYSIAAGYKVRVDTAASYTFAFGRDFTTTTPDAVVLYNSVNSMHVGIQNTAPTHLLDVGESGAYCDGGAWFDGSSREYKKDVSDLGEGDALEAVLGLRPVRFKYRSDEDERVGFIAEDVPNLIATADRKGISPTEVVAVLTKVVQKQQRMLERQQEEIESLRMSLEALSR